MSWASEELAGTHLGDERLNRRLVRIVEDLSARPGARVPVASRNKAALRFLVESTGGRGRDFRWTPSVSGETGV